MRRIFLLILNILIVVNSANAEETDKFKDAYRAAATIKGAFSVGISLTKFKELMQDFSTEMVILREAVESQNVEEAEKLKKFEVAFEGYTLLRDLMEAVIARGLYGFSILEVQEEDYKTLVKTLGFSEFVSVEDELVYIPKEVIDKDPGLQLLQADTTLVPQKLRGVTLIFSEISEKCWKFMSKKNQKEE